MSQTVAFIQRLESLKEGERSRLRRLVGQPLDKTLPGFDLFTGLWWPLRRTSPFAPRRETSWMVAKLYGAFPLPDVRPGNAVESPTLPRVLGLCEPRDEQRQRRFRTRFDALLCSPLPAVEQHLRWGLSVTADAVTAKLVAGIDWAKLLDDLSIWDRGEEHRRKRDIRDIWAEAYLSATRQTSHQPQGAGHAH